MKIMDLSRTALRQEIQTIIESSGNNNNVDWKKIDQLKKSYWSLILKENGVDSTIIESIVKHL